MAQITIDVVRVDKLPGAGRIVEIEAEAGDNRIVRTINLDDFDTWEEFAAWLVNQQPDRVSQADWRRRLVVDFHVEQGEDGSVRVVDAVAVQPLA